MNKRCFYFVEGECEETLINALKKDPAKIIPGRVKKWNVIDRVLPNSILNTIQPGCGNTLADLILSKQN